MTTETLFEWSQRACVAFDGATFEPELDEQWLVVPGFESYSVSNFGRILSARRRGHCGGIVKPWKMRAGYWAIKMSKGNISKGFLVHRIVMLAFCYRPDADSLQVNHIDGNKLNNALSNLEWVTRSGNLRHATYVLKHNTVARPVLQLSLDGSFIAQFDTMASTGFRIPSISEACLSGLPYKGFLWRFQKGPTCRTHAVAVRVETEDQRERRMAGVRAYIAANRNNPDFRARRCEANRQYRLRLKAKKMEASR